MWLFRCLLFSHFIKYVHFSIYFIMVWCIYRTFKNLCFLNWMCFLCHEFYNSFSSIKCYENRKCGVLKWDSNCRKLLQRIFHTRLCQAQYFTIHIPYLHVVFYNFKPFNQKWLGYQLPAKSYCNRILQNKFQLLLLFWMNGNFHFIQRQATDVRWFLVFFYFSLRCSVW